VAQGRLTVRSTDAIAELYRRHGIPAAPARGAVAPPVPADPSTPEEAWTRALVDEIRRFATGRSAAPPLVRVTLDDGEQFFLAGLDPRPGHGFVTLYAHPERTPHAVAGGVDPRPIVVPPSRLRKVELLDRVPRGTRSGVGFWL